MKSEKVGQIAYCGLRGVNNIAKGMMKRKKNLSFLFLSSDGTAHPLSEP